MNLSRFDELRAAIERLNAAREKAHAACGAAMKANGEVRAAELACEDLGLSINRPDPDPILAMFDPPAKKESTKWVPGVGPVRAAIEITDRSLEARRVTLHESPGLSAPCTPGAPSIPGEEHEQNAGDQGQ